MKPCPSLIRNSKTQGPPTTALAQPSPSAAAFAADDGKAVLQGLRPSLVRVARLNPCPSFINTRRKLVASSRSTEATSFCSPNLFKAINKLYRQKQIVLLDTSDVEVGRPSIGIGIADRPYRRFEFAGSTCQIELCWVHVAPRYAC